MYLNFLNNYCFTGNERLYTKSKMVFLKSNTQRHNTNRYISYEPNSAPVTVQ